MEKTKLLNQLENIASKVNLEYVPELAGLINELKAEIYSESNGKINKSLLQRTKAALKFLKNAGNKGRDIFKYCDYQNIAGTDYQVFTDSYTLFMLVDKMELPYYKDSMPNASYPNAKNLCSASYYDTDITESIDIKDIMAKLKAKMLPIDNKIAKYVNKNVNANGKTVAIAFNANYLKTIVDILGTSELKVYYRDNTIGYSPLLFVDESTENKALLVPMRLPEAQ